MTLIRIEPTEMETATRELQAQADTVSQAVTGLRGQCTQACLPPAVAGQVDTTLATLERSLTDIRTELLLEGVILALRGILAIKGSAVAGELVPAPVTVPTSSTLGGWTGTGFSSYGTPQEPTVAGWTGTGFSSYGTPLAPTVAGWTGTGFTAASTGVMGIAPGGVGSGLKPLGITDIPTFESPFIKPEANDNKTWAGSMTKDSDGDGVLNGRDVNPGSYDKEYSPSFKRDNPGIKPKNF